jgi:HD-GYP domain-containing protein (c-di-GMP phosphodiesterase class II)
MKSHVHIGQHILEKSKWLEGAQEIVSCHHERFDGKGYPNGLQGEYIPFKARLFSIVDVFDALTSVRPYKNEMSYSDAVKIMLEESGKGFDSLILGKFLDIAPEAYAKN